MLDGNINITQISFLGYFIFSLIAGVIIYTQFQKKNKEIKKLKEEINKLNDLDNLNKIDLNKGEQALKILDNLIDKKFDFYLYKEILPRYLASEVSSPFKKDELKKLKDKFYSDIVLSVNKNFKKELLNIYTSEGVGLYVHERFMNLFNKVDSKFINKSKLNSKDPGFFVE